MPTRQWGVGVTAGLPWGVRTVREERGRGPGRGDGRAGRSPEMLPSAPLGDGGGFCLRKLDWDWGLQASPGPRGPDGPFRLQGLCTCCPFCLRRPSRRWLPSSPLRTLPDTGPLW